jgi:hypothetical protein
VVNERIWAEAEEMMLEKLSQDATDFAEEILNEC